MDEVVEDAQGRGEEIHCLCVSGKVCNWIGYDDLPLLGPPV